MHSNQKIAVLGAGIVGMSTALEFQARFPSCEITILADKFEEATTSDGAAGVFEPSPKFIGPDLETTRKWIRDSFDHYSSLLHEPCGVKVLEGYALAKYDEKCVENHYLKPVLPVYRRLGEEELSEISPGDWKYGTFMSTLSIPCRKFLPWAVSKFKKAGGNVLVCHIENLAELSPEYDVVFNCTGLGAGALCDDMHVIPIRGQVIRIQDASLDKFYMAEYGTYIVPNCYDNLVTLGGTQNFGSWNRSVDPFDTESILERCAQVCPRLRLYRGKQLGWAGLRPYRYAVRVEYEPTPNVKIIHNYGHGGYGVTSAPGTAKYAVDIFETMHRSNVRY